MKIYIATLGCKLNQFESQALTENLTANGHQIVETLDEANAVIVNTCTVTARADSKSRQVMKRARKLGQKVIAVGCLATTNGEDLTAAGLADSVLPNTEKMRVASIIGEWEKTPPQTEFCGDFPEVHRFERTRAFLKVQDGCDKFCSYCKIPYARGRSRSVDIPRALEMAAHLIGEGFHELVVTGINISSFNADGAGLFELCEALLSLPGDFRLRLSSLQPDEFDRRIIPLLSHPKMCNQLHLSIQSASDTVLKRMNRRYDTAFFDRLLSEIRAGSPSCGITTDCIVGFPGETDEEFSATLEYFRTARFTRVHLFPYSRREGTHAAKLPDLPQKIKKEREAALREASEEGALSFAREFWLGKTTKALAENEFSGYTSEYARAVVSGGGLTENQFFEFVPLAARIAPDGGVELLDTEDDSES